MADDDDEVSFIYEDAASRSARYWKNAADMYSRACTATTD